MGDDDLSASIPSISVTRDAEVGRSSGEIPKRYKTPSSIGAFPRLVITTSIVVSAVACAWAWQLQRELDEVSSSLGRYSTRTADLEDLLSDTDETVNQSAAAMRIQLKRLDTENRKLWDARKVSNKKITQLEDQSKLQGSGFIDLKKSTSNNGVQLKVLEEEVSRFTSLAQDLTNLTSSAKKNQSEVERVADGINRIDLEQTRLTKRISENEGWIESINAFRRQINGRIMQLEEASIRAQQDLEIQSNSD